MIYNATSFYAHKVGKVQTGFDLRDQTVTFPVPDLPAGKYFLMREWLCHFVVRVKIESQLV